MISSKDFYGSKRELVFVGAIVMVLVILFTPIPSFFLDILLIINLSFALGILTLTIYTDKPTSFSTFPSILLLATLFRLSLNIAATRLILDGAHAGDVIGSVGSYVVGGNYIIGLVVFFILIVVQYVVVTNGAQRIAEVAARFTLDSMPGKQMSIDADLNMGIIDHEEANARRKNIEKEANFYGAMDGASKFVKGDAIAGIIIILIDIIGGLAIGIAQLGMDWSEALHTYTLLTVGDGIVTQIPALVISVATGIIVTRAASDGELGREVFDQIGKYPRSIIIIMVALLVLALLPSMPIIPIALLFIALGIIFYFITQQKEISEDEEQSDYDYLSDGSISIKVGSEMYDGFGGDDWFEDKVRTIKKDFISRLGVVLPNIKIYVGEEHSAYDVSYYGASLGRGELEKDKVLAILPSKDAFILEGTRTKDPAFGLDAIWIDQESKADAVKFGYNLIESKMVFLTHLSELMRNNLEDFINRDFLDSLLAKAREGSSDLVDEVIPEKITINRLLVLLRMLVSENISVEYLIRILQILSEIDAAEISDDQLYELVRQRMTLHLCGESIDNGVLKVIAISSQIERNLIESTNGSSIMHATGFEEFLKSAIFECEQMIANKAQPIILSAPIIRRELYLALSKSIPSVVVLSTKEIPKQASLEAVSIIK